MSETEIRGARILVLDDEPANLRLLERLLTRAGYTDLVLTDDPRRLDELRARTPPDLLLLDLNMPHRSGLTILEQLRDTPAPGAFLPVIVLTAEITAETRRRALDAGATDFITKPFDHTEVLLRIRNVLRTRLLHVQLDEHNALLEQRVKERTTELEQALGELRLTQQRLVQRERLHALGMMAAGIAHDFNNLLSTIIGYSEVLLREDCGPHTPAEQEQYLGMVLNAARDAAQIVSRLAQFQRPRRENDVRQMLALHELAQQVVALTRPRWHGQASAAGFQIDVSVTAIGDLPVIQGDPAELREMLTNLIFNAADAMPQGGQITIRTRAEPGAAVLEVADTGTGMTPEVRARCLEPFFSTKGEHGSGLGLSMIYGIIERHGGSLDIRTAPGRGTTFFIRLPLPPQGRLAASAPARDDSPEPLRIRAADDQPMAAA